MEKRIVLLCNSKAGKGEATRINSWLESQLKNVCLPFESFKDDWPSQLGDYSDAWIIGGDGTLNYFINKYPNCELPLFIFRGGTGNDFAWKLYQKKSLDECFKIAIEKAASKVDAGICNGKYFLNGVGIGFDGEIARSIHAQKRYLKGHLAYYATVVRKIFSFQETEFEVITKDISWKMQTFMLTIANASRYGGGFLVAPNAKVDDGLLDLVLIPRINIFQRLNLLPGASSGKHLRVGLSARSEAVTVKAGKSVHAHLDGEVLASENFEINILPQKFNFRY